jgi:hypothetical protein
MRGPTASLNGSVRGHTAPSHLPSLGQSPLSRRPRDARRGAARRGASRIEVVVDGSPDAGVCGREVAVCRPVAHTNDFPPRDGRLGVKRVGLGQHPRMSARSASAGPTSTGTPSRPRRSYSRPMTASRDVPGGKSTRRSMSLSGWPSPRATDPKARTLRAPRAGLVLAAHRSEGHPARPRVATPLGSGSQLESYRPTLWLPARGCGPVTPVHPGRPCVVRGQPGDPRHPATSGPSGAAASPSRRWQLK